MEGLLVSIIIPTLNAQRTLEQCLSLLLECPGGTEILICDGGSEDETLRIAENKGKKVRILDCSQEKGIYGAMNKGIEEARGKWLYFCGADDFIAEPCVFTKALEGVTEKTDLVIGRVRNLPPRHKRVKEWYEPTWGSMLLLSNQVHHQGAIYHSRIFQNYRYPTEYKVFGDYHLNLMLWKQGVDVQFTQQHIAEAGSDGISKRFTSGLYKEEFRMKRGVLAFHEWFWQPIWLLLKYLRKQI